VLVLVDGRSRVDPQLLEREVGEPVERPDADWVRARTGFAIGGIPPLGHAESLRTFVDRGLVDQAEVWAAAGTPHAVFPVAGDRLAELTGGLVADVAAG
jgi:prolyl-tRNA editing enzyme YbaK/EbsC (Cys-tRNA(Pro) deacylase)